MGEIIYFGTDKVKIKEVYSDYITPTSKIFDSEDLDKHDFENVEIIFSTWNMPRLTSDQVKRYFPNLKVIFYAAGTIKYFSEPFFENGIRIFSADKVNAIPVSEFVTAQILLATKGYFQTQRYYRKLMFRKARTCALSHSGNYKAKIGIIGVGNIGRRIIEKLKSYDLQIFANDINLDKEEAALLGIELKSLEDIFKECDVISNHLPNIPSTEGILNYNLFKLMKSYSTFINTGRGQQIEDKGLKRALKEDKSRCALIDVLRREPILPWNPLFGLSNVFITPHIAGSTNNEVKRMADAVMNAYSDYLDGKTSELEIFGENLSFNA